MNEQNRDCGRDPAPVLVVMAAGMGSRFGGLKQLEPLGPAGEVLLDYSVYDAMQAGFRTVVFVIKREMEADFRAAVGDRIARHAGVRYAYQELDRLPEGFRVPEGRAKPWGTGHAVLCCQGVVDGPFAVINADDYYGRECYRQLYNYLTRERPAADAPLPAAMAAFRLDNTLTENGSVSRGVCDVDGDGLLRGITERVRIERRPGGPAYTENDGGTWTPLSPDTRVSMNFWGFPTGTLTHFEREFHAFMETDGERPGSEFYLPAAVDGMIRNGDVRVRVLDTGDRWYGVTYRADAQPVRAALADMTARGLYPQGVLR